VYVTIREWLQQLLGEQTYVQAWQEGRTIPVEEVIEILSGLLSSYEHNQPESRQLSRSAQGPNILSERELEVIGCIAEGFSNQEIADRLFITERTVRFHVTSIFNKLGVNNRTQAVVIAAQRGLIKTK
jgi:DNA-binding NarL/FixJ family response regulator